MPFPFFASLAFVCFSKEDLEKIKEDVTKIREDQEKLKASQSAVLSAVQGLRTIDRLFYGGVTLFFATAVYTLFWMHDHEIKLQDILHKFELKLGAVSSQAKVADEKANILSENFSGLLSNEGVKVEKKDT